MLLEAFFWENKKLRISLKEGRKNTERGEGILKLREKKKGWKERWGKKIENEAKICWYNRWLEKYPDTICSVAILWAPVRRILLLSQINPLLQTCPLHILQLWLFYLQTIDCLVQLLLFQFLEKSRYLILMNNLGSAANIIWIMATQWNKN